MNTLTLSKPKYLVWGLLVLGLIGLLDAVIITINHYIPGPPPDFSYWFGIPSAPVGIGFYTVIVFLIISYLRSGAAWQFNVLMGLLIFELLSGINAFIQQTFVLQFFCPYAYLYVAVSVTMFALGVALRSQK